MSKQKQSGIMGALTRKIGPLPAWAWAILGGIAVWYYRNKLSAASSTGTSSTLPSTDTSGQQPVVLSPGESVYDPNTGGLSSAPSTGGGTGGTDIGTAIDDLAAAIAAGQNTGTNNSLAPGSTGTTGGDGSSGGTGGINDSGTAVAPPTPQAGLGPTRMSTVTKAQAKSGDIAAPYGAKKPTAVPTGYKVVGTGKGNWVYKPKSIKSTPKTTRNSKKK